MIALNQTIKKSILDEKIRTPVYLYDKGSIESQVNLLKKQKTKNNLKLDIYYAMKANSHVSILKVLKDLGLGVEIASGGELFKAKIVGFSPEKIIYTGPVKTDKELQEAVEYGIKTIHIESFNEAVRLNKICSKLNKKQDILIRVNSNFKIETYSTSVSGGPSPFGILQEELEQVLPKVSQLNNLKLQGIHVFNASGVLDYTKLLENVRLVFEMVKNLQKSFNPSLFSVVDFGGGLGIDYSEKGEDVDVQKFFEGVDKFIQEYSFEGKKLIMEVGRYIVAQSGYYISKIIDKKYSRGEVFLLTDGGIHQQMRPKFFGQNHPVSILTKAKNNNILREKVTITGSLCTSVDVLAQDVTLQKAEIGDYVIIEKSGAYSLSASMNHFLSHSSPREILFSNEGYRTITEEESYEDMLNRQSF